MPNNRTNSLPASPDHNAALAEHAASIRSLGKCVVEDVIEIGRLLTEAKALAGRGNWLPWLEREFGWSADTAERFIQLNALSGQIPQLAEFNVPISGLYLLAAPSTPKKARDKIIERARARETVPVAEVKRIIDDTKGRKQPARKAEKKSDRRVTRRPTVGDMLIDEMLDEAAKAAADKPKPKPRDDVGADSRAEAERLRVCVEELQTEKRRLEFKITGLEREIEELRGKLATATGGDMSISEFQAAHKEWEDTVETQRGIIARLEKENATLRAVVAAPPDDGLDIPPPLRRAAS
jgi:hypothetical protein